MSPMRIIILLLALVAAGGAALLVSRMSPEVVTEAVTRTETLIQQREVSEVRVLTVTRDLGIGQQVQAEDLKWSVWPESGLAEGQLTEKGAPNAIEEVTGALVRMPIFANEPVQPKRLVKRGESGLLPALMDPGMRAVAIRISTETASGGFILPNDRVDLILTYELQNDQPDGRGGNRMVSSTILQNVRVLAIDQTYTTNPEVEPATRIGNTATLEVTPSEAELVAMSQERGRLFLALRPLDEVTIAADRRPRYEVMTGRGDGNPGVTIIRNSKPAPAAMGGN